MRILSQLSQTPFFLGLLPTINYNQSEDRFGIFISDSNPFGFDGSGGSACDAKAGIKALRFGDVGGVTRPIPEIPAEPTGISSSSNSNSNSNSVSALVQVQPSPKDTRLYLDQVIQDVILKIDRFSSLDLVNLNDQLIRTGTPDFFYALGRYFKLGQNKVLGQRAIKEISYDSVKAVCVRYPDEAAAILLFFKHNGSVPVRLNLERLKKEVYDHVYGDSANRPIKEAFIDNLDRLHKVSAHDDLSGLFALYAHHSEIFGFIVLSAIVNNHPTALSYLMRIAKTQGYHQQRAMQILSCFAK